MFEVGEEVDINRIPYIVTAFDGQKYIMEMKRD
jgi:hypothetical protein